MPREGQIASQHPCDCSSTHAKPSSHGSPAARRLLDRCRRGPAVQASFFGVGAPEAILVGVVALVVFGPKGLAQVRPRTGMLTRRVSWPRNLIDLSVWSMAWGASLTHRLLELHCA